MKPKQLGAQGLLPAQPRLIGFASWDAYAEWWMNTAHAAFVAHGLTRGELVGRPGTTHRTTTPGCRRAPYDVHSCIQSKLLGILNWVSGSHMIISGGRRHVSFFSGEMPRRFEWMQECTSCVDECHWCHLHRGGLSVSQAVTRPVSLPVKSHL